MDKHLQLPLKCSARLVKNVGNCVTILFDFTRDLSEIPAKDFYCIHKNPTPAAIIRLLIIACQKLCDFNSVTNKNPNILLPHLRFGCFHYIINYNLLSLGLINQLLLLPKNEEGPRKASVLRGSCKQWIFYGAIKFYIPENTVKKTTGSYWSRK